MATIKLSGCVVTSISGSVGHLNFLLQGKPFSRHRVHLPAKHKRKQSVTAKARLSSYHGKRLAERPDKIVYNQGKYCACNAYLVADYLWNSGLIDQMLWRRAVKKSQFSAYDLWLYEAVGLAKQGKYLPDVPSISGGYSRNSLIEGRRFQPPADCIQVQQLDGAYTAVKKDTLPPHTVRWVAFHGLDPSTWLGLAFHQPALCRWYFHPTLLDAYVDIWHTFDNYLTAKKVWNPLYPNPCRMVLFNIRVTLNGQRIEHQHNGYDPAYLYAVSSVPDGPYQALGKWQ